LFKKTRNFLIQIVVAGVILNTTISALPQMTQYDIWKLSIQELAELQAELTDHGSAIEEPELTNEIHHRQVKLLRSFGLPHAPDYLRFITFEEIPTDAAIEEKISVLKNAAVVYLLTDAKSEIKILQQAKDQKLNPFTVLPELNIKIHIYTIFVYDKILIPGKDSIENIWEELKRTRDPKVLEYTGRIGLKLYDFEKHIDYQKLLQYTGLKYLNLFINTQIALLNDEEY